MTPSIDQFPMSAEVYFFNRYQDAVFAYRRMFMIPRVGDKCVFNEVRYKVAIVEWCLDSDADLGGIRVNVELELMQGVSTKESKET